MYQSYPRALKGTNKLTDAQKELKSKASGVLKKFSKYKVDADDPLLLPPDKYLLKIGDVRKLEKLKLKNILVAEPHHMHDKVSVLTLDYYMFQDGYKMHGHALWVDIQYDKDSDWATNYVGDVWYKISYGLLNWMKSKMNKHPLHNNKNSFDGYLFKLAPDRKATQRKAPALKKKAVRKPKNDLFDGYLYKLAPEYKKEAQKKAAALKKKAAPQKVAQKKAPAKAPKKMYAKAPPKGKLRNSAAVQNFINQQSAKKANMKRVVKAKPEGKYRPFKRGPGGELRPSAAYWGHVLKAPVGYTLYYGGKKYMLESVVIKGKSTFRWMPFKA